MRRQSKLRDKWFFSCRCSRCVDPTEKNSFVSSLMCQLRAPSGMPCAGVMSACNPLDDVARAWVCDGCANNIAGKDVLFLENE
jgi:hypothetical protein